MEIMEIIKQCIDKKMNVEINYRNSDKEVYKKRIVSPHLLVEPQKGNPILIARYVSGLTEVEERAASRSYKVLNILDAKATKYSFDIDETLRPRDSNVKPIASVF
jgi:predicted DNA-binding transcriptional regulator YafY